MSTELEALTACKSSPHVYSTTERMAAVNLYKCAAKVSPAIVEDDILKDFDRLIASYDAADIVQQKALLQLQTLDTVFHYFVSKGCTSDSDYFRQAFVAQKLFTDLTKTLATRTQPIAISNGEEK